IQALVQKLIDEDMIRQKAILDLALQFDSACTAKDGLRKAYEKCNDISQESPLSRGHRFNPAWRPYTNKDQPSIPRITEVHWFRPALDSSGERPQLPTSVVSYRVSTRDTYYTLTVGVLQQDQ
nr:hypothetical protein [Tanacetum cinerariifolium]